MRKSGCKWLSRSLIVGPYLALCLTEKDFDEKFAEIDSDAGKQPFLGRDHCDATTHYWRTKDGKPAAIVTVRLSGKETFVQVSALLVHEAVHIFGSFCEQIGEQHPSSEFEAYGIQALAQELIQSYQDQMPASRRSAGRRAHRVGGKRGRRRA